MGVAEAMDCMVQVAGQRRLAMKHWQVQLRQDASSYMTLEVEAKTREEAEVKARAAIDDGLDVADWSDCEYGEIEIDSIEEGDLR